MTTGADWPYGLDFSSPLPKETIEQERTRYRRAYEGLRKAIETEIQQSRSVGENWRTHDLISSERNRIVMRLTEMLEGVDAKA